jgi:hypothetical protein
MWLTTQPYQINDSNPINAKPSDTLVQRIRLLGDSLSKFATQLDPTDAILSEFPQQPALEYVHIIVKVTDTGECE